MAGTAALALVFFLANLQGAIPEKALDLYHAGSLLGDQVKLNRAWRLAPRPEIAASLTESWLFEFEVNIDEELVGTPPFLQVLVKWEEEEPDNALVPCLREVFRTAREEHLPDWDRLGALLRPKRRVFFHYGEERRQSLRFILERRGNTLESWLRWLGRAPLTNVGRVSQLVESALVEARFLLFTGEIERSRELTDLAGRITDLVVAEDDEIRLRKSSLEGAVLQQRLLFDLAVKGGGKAEPLIARYRKTLAEERASLSRVSVLSALHQDIIGAYRLAYRDLRSPRWDDMTSVDPSLMAAFADAYVKRGSEAVDDFWRYREATLEDFTVEVEKYLDVFKEKEPSRATAGRFMDFLRKSVSNRKGVPTWAIPAYLRIRKVYKNAPALGRKTLSEKDREAFVWLTGALGYLGTGEPAKTEEWINAFRRGKARPYLLLAFARHRVEAAVPAVIEAMRLLRGRVSRTVLLDYALCLRTLTGKDFGLDPEAWRKWYARSGEGGKKKIRY